MDNDDDEECRDGSDKELIMSITSEVIINTTCDSKYSKKKKKEKRINDENNQIDLHEISQGY